MFKAFSLKASPDGSISIGIDVDPELGRADSGDLELDLSELLADLGEAARDLDAGVVLLIDELQELPRSDVAALAGAAHHTNRRELPVAVVGAGLPHLPGVLTDAKSYAERLFSYRNIGALHSADAAQALTRPAESRNVVWEMGALRHARDQAAGYPYFLQVWGKHTWGHADRSPIQLADAKHATVSALAQLDAGFFRVRFDRCTPSQKRYLRAMAELGAGPHQSGTIAKQLGMKVTSAGPTRNHLIKKGMIYSPAHGNTAFTVPLFDGFLKRVVPAP